MHHLEIVPFYSQVTDVPDALVLAQVMVPPLGLGTDALRALSCVRESHPHPLGCAGCPWLHFSGAGMGYWGTLLGCVLQFHRAWPSQVCTLGCLGLSTLSREPLGAHSLM